MANPDKKKQETKNKAPIPKTSKKRKGTRDKYVYWISEEGLALVNGWARDGLTDEEIAGKIGIQRTTIYDWKKRFPDFADALKNGKEVVDYKVEQALLKKALGFKETIRKPVRLRRGEDWDEIEYVDEEIYYPPDTTAQIFWLKNRKPNRWKNDDRYIVEKNDAEEKQADMHQITLEALKSRIVPGFNDEDESITNNPEKEAGEGA
ncbi:MAG TPA: helix-turn-helix domain-containing protein [Clostridia bacterium]